MKFHYYILTIIYCGIIFWLSSRPIPEIPGVGFSGMDKIAHIVVFGGLAVLVAVGLRRSNDYVRPAIQYLVPLAVTIGYGAIDELHQAFIPVRTADIFDLIADSIGAVLAVILCCRVLWGIPFGAIWTSDCNPTLEDGIQ